MRFHLDRCTAAEIIGWVDDDGPVSSLDLELNGKWVSSVTPDMPRPDLVAAGYGDGKRGFAVSLLDHLRGLPTVGASIALKYHGATLYEGPILDPGRPRRSAWRCD